MKISKHKQLLLAFVGILLTILIAKTALLLTAKPKVTVDYLAEYNRMSLPQDYDPNENAAPYYQKAFDVFVAMPEGLEKPYINWPADFNSAEQNQLEKWLASNAQAFEYFREAVNKPYYWIERKSEKDNTVAGIMLPESSLFYKITKSLAWNAKSYAAKGQSQMAFQYILDCYRAGKHKCHPNYLLTEQLIGLHIKQDAVYAVLIMLDKSRFDSNDLKFFQDNLQAEFEKDTFIPNFQAEKLFLYDALQYLYADNGKGTGRLAWRTGWPITPLAELDKSEFERKYENLKQRLYCCLIGPTRNETSEQIENIINISQQAMAKTPWQIKSESLDYFNEIEKIKKGYFLLGISDLNPKRISYKYYEMLEQRNALIAILAILRYKNETGQFPESLEKLVSTKYMETIPNDPYSNGSLIYKQTESNFILYSVGDNFQDDGGVIKVSHKASHDSLMSPPIACSPDIVYWPVKDFKNPMYACDPNE